MLTWKSIVLVVAVCWAGNAAALEWDCRQHGGFKIENTELLKRIAAQGHAVEHPSDCPEKRKSAHSECEMLIRGFPSIAVGDPDTCFISLSVIFDEGDKQTQRRDAVLLSRIILNAIRASKKDIDAMDRLLKGETHRETSELIDDVDGKNGVPNVDCCLVQTAPTADNGLMLSISSND